jgi:hypothetical protein
VSLIKVAPRGGNRAYQYRYANPAEVGPRQPLQLQFWVPKGRKGGRWVPADRVPQGHDASVYARTWRRVRPHAGRPDKLAHRISAVSAGYARSVADQVALYMTWAAARGLARVHRFNNCKYVPPRCGSLDIVSVDPAEFIGPAPEAEACE